ncbi:MAG: DUF465 domain-containing protein [Methylococcaceae bacterium]|nr:DUF465 domain-containing protein [Methylococcaceae bacterium]
MLNEKHDLVHELPEHRDAIHDLKISSRHFARLFDEYHKTDDEIHHIETGIKTTSDDYLDSKKKQRLHLKDELLKMIQKA